MGRFSAFDALKVQLGHGSCNVRASIIAVELGLIREELPLVLCLTSWLWMHRFCWSIEFWRSLSVAVVIDNRLLSSGHDYWSGYSRWLMLHLALSAFFRLVVLGLDKLRIASPIQLLASTEWVLIFILRHRSWVKHLLDCRNFFRCGHRATCSFVPWLHFSNQSE